MGMLVTHRKYDGGTVALRIGNIGEEVYIPDSAFVLLPCLRKALGDNARVFPLFCDDGRMARFDLGNVKGESIPLSVFSELTISGLTRIPDCEEFKSRLDTIKSALENFAQVLRNVLAPGIAEEVNVRLPSPSEASDLYRYVEASDGGFCFVTLGVERIGKPWVGVSVAAVAQYVMQTAEKLDSLLKDIDRRINELKPSVVGKLRDLFGDKKTETAAEESGKRSICGHPVWDMLDGKGSDASETETVSPITDDAPSPYVTPEAVDVSPEFAMPAEQPVVVQPAETPPESGLPASSDVPADSGAEPVLEQQEQPSDSPAQSTMPVQQPPQSPSPIPQSKPQPPFVPVVQSEAEPLEAVGVEWKSVPSDQQAQYAKPDSAMAFQACGDVSIVAASLRGRSHALKGDFREDDFRIHYDPLTRCAFLAVSDGAGSAKYSRKGSEIAVKVAVEEATAAFTAEFWKDAELVVRNWNDNHGELDGKNLAIKLYPLIQAAFKARTAIFQEAGQQNAKAGGNVKVKDFAATLILTIVKQFDFGWFVVTYWVGDGGVCVYKQNGRKATVMGEADSGEFAGETCFLTTSEVWHADAQALIDRRLRFGVFKSFKAVVLMTDGVSDAKFGADASFADFSRWDAFWMDISSTVPFERRDKTTADALLKWLGFHVKGEFDDRTLVILY